MMSVVLPIYTHSFGLNFFALFKCENLERLYFILIQLSRALKLTVCDLRRENGVSSNFQLISSHAIRPFSIGGFSHNVLSRPKIGPNTQTCAHTECLRIIISIKKYFTSFFNSTLTEV